MQTMQPGMDTKPEEDGIDPEEIRKIIFGLARMFEGDRNGSRDFTRPRPTQPSQGFNTQSLQAPPLRDRNNIGGSSIQRDATAVKPSPSQVDRRFQSPSGLSDFSGPIAMQQDATGLTETGASGSRQRAIVEARNDLQLQRLFAPFVGDQEIPRLPGSPQEAAFEASKKPSIGSAGRSLDPRDYLPEGVQRNLNQGPIGTGLDAIGFLLKNASIADVETGGISLFTRAGLKALAQKFLPNAAEAAARNADRGRIADNVANEALRSADPKLADDLGVGLNLQVRTWMDSFIQNNPNATVEEIVKEQSKVLAHLQAPAGYESQVTTRRGDGSEQSLGTLVSKGKTEDPKTLGLVTGLGASIRQALGNIQYPGKGAKASGDRILESDYTDKIMDLPYSSGRGAPPLPEGNLFDYEVQRILESEGLARRNKDELVAEFDKLERDVMVREDLLANTARLDEKDRLEAANQIERLRVARVDRNEKLARPVSVNINTTPLSLLPGTQGPHRLSEQPYGEDDFISKSRTGVDVGLGDHTVARLSVEADAPMIGSSRNEEFIPEIFVWNKDAELFDEFVDSGKLNEAIETAIGKTPFARSSSRARIYYVGGKRNSHVIDLPNLSKNVDPSLFANARDEARRAMAAGDRSGATSALRAFLSGETRGVNFGPTIPSRAALDRIGEGRMSKDNPDSSQLDFDFDQDVSINIPADYVHTARVRGQLPPEGERSRTFFVRDEGGNIVGSLGISEDGSGGKDLNVNVHRDYKRQGVGTNLYQQAYNAGYDIEALSGRGMSDEGRAFRRGRLDQAAAGTGGVVTDEAYNAAPRSDLPIKIANRTPPPANETPDQAAGAAFNRAIQDYYHSSDPNAIYPVWEDFAPPGTPPMSVAQMQYDESYSSVSPQAEARATIRTESLNERRRRLGHDLYYKAVEDTNRRYDEVVAEWRTSGSHGEIPNWDNLWVEPQPRTPIDKLGNELQGERNGPIGGWSHPNPSPVWINSPQPIPPAPTGYQRRPAIHYETIRQRFDRLGEESYFESITETSRRHDVAYEAWESAGNHGDPPNWDDYWIEPKTSNAPLQTLGPKLQSGVDESTPLETLGSLMRGSKTSVARERAGPKAYDDAMMLTENRFTAAWSKWLRSDQKSPEPTWDDFWVEPPPKASASPLESLGNELRGDRKGPLRADKSPRGTPGDVLSLKPQGPKGPEASPHGMVGGVNFIDLSRIINQEPTGPANLSIIPRTEGVDLKAILDQLADTDRLDEMLRMLDKLPPEERIEAGIRWMLANPKGGKPPKPPTRPRIVP